MLFDFDDLLIVPEVLSIITSRSECNVYDDKGFLPLFTAPMDTVINENNWEEFYKNKIYSIIPRGLNKEVISFEEKKWYSYGLDEFNEIFIDSNQYHNVDKPFYALIDIANGHMFKLLKIATKAKEIYGSRIVLMIGNIANPSTYKSFAEIGVDYIRLGIGNGAGCLTTQQTGVGYPMASLINETYAIKKRGNYDTKIVADGGFKKFADVIKALALGADYVMLGSMLNKALESAAEMIVETYHENQPCQMSIQQWKNIKSGYYKENTEPTDLEIFNSGITLLKKYRGMSTKEVQQSWGRTELKTAEGISKFQKVEYTLEGWTKNFKDYLASAMSYTDSIGLKTFRDSEFKLITQNSFKRFDK